MKELQVPFDATINKNDSETQTFGCRANNPNICSSNGIPGVCAFASEDHICRKPSRAWKKQYQKLNS